jgi:hypothetical protein
LYHANKLFVSEIGMEYALSHRASRMAIFHSQLGQAHELLMNATQENKAH